jgi:hypothetical protein
MPHLQQENSCTLLISFAICWILKNQNISIWGNFFNISMLRIRILLKGNTKSEERTGFTHVTNVALLLGVFKYQ